MADAAPGMPPEPPSADDGLDETAPVAGRGESGGDAARRIRRSLARGAAERDRR